MGCELEKMGVCDLNLGLPAGVLLCLKSRRTNFPVVTKGCFLETFNLSISKPAINTPL